MQPKRLTANVDVSYVKIKYAMHKFVFVVIVSTGDAITIPAKVFNNNCL